MVRINDKDFLKGVKEEVGRKRTPLGRLVYSFRHRGEEKHKRNVALKLMMDKAGLRKSPSYISRALFILSVIVNIFITIYVVDRFYDVLRYNFVFIAVVLAVMWIFVFVVVLFVIWLLFYLSLDVMIFKRRQKLEEVLPDFLQLASSNIRAGMTIDQALWFAVRPRFGVLATEIEEVAKRTFAGETLDAALLHFVNKYDSKVLERSMNLLIEGVRAGGEIGDLLNKISENIQETNLMKKEMAANVTTYVIFITFATLFAAPFLFGMAYQLIIVIQEVFSRVDITPGTAAGFPVMITKGVISTGDFQTFAIVSLMITSLFSSMIISTIKRGNVKAGLKYIPVFMVCSIILFLIVVKVFSMFTEGFF
ncbi:type II secretion system F family protein [Candidatus Woesearchaeota archaeon]|nr:type II secretion system F family protein [Candidatus Woesearchaeota archaeon]